MARKELDYTVETDGRDKGKVFHLVEFPAARAERWAFRAFLAMGRSGVDVPENVMSLGFVGAAKMLAGAICKLPYADAESLMDEMMECVTIKPSPKITRALVEDDIEEILTRVLLRIEVIKLHAGFSTAASQ